MRLTPELLARVPPAGAPGAVPSGRSPGSDDDYRHAVADILSTAPSSGDFWVFAYGSLIWNPTFAFAEKRVARARGWHRAFCLGWDRWFRGCEERPGLMLALDRGGQCTGVAFRLPPQSLEAELDGLVRREIRFFPPAYARRWIRTETADGPVDALTFVIDRTQTSYVGGLSPDEIADALAVAAGQLGSMCEYVHSTIEHLEAHGLHDRALWRLEAMIARRLEARDRAGAPPVPAS